MTKQTRSREETDFGVVHSCNFFSFLAPAVVIDDLGRELLDKGGGRARGKLGERKLICPWAVGQNTVPALFHVSDPSLRNDDTLLQAHINL